MIETVTRTRFINWFRQSDTYKNQFSFFAQASLYDYFEEYEEDTGEKIEFDPIAICCDYTEYENIEEYNQDYEPVESIDKIRELTTVIEIPQNKNLAKLPVPPLPPQPAPVNIKTVQAPVNQATGLTSTETALLSPGEQAIRLKQKGLA